MTFFYKNLEYIYLEYRMFVGFVGFTNQKYNL